MRRNRRLPSIKIKKDKPKFYPFRRCEFCSVRWKRTDLDPKTRVALKVSSCIDACRLVQGA